MDPNELLRKIMREDSFSGFTKNHVQTGGSSSISSFSRLNAVLQRAADGALKFQRDLAMGKRKGDNMTPEEKAQKINELKAFAAKARAERSVSDADALSLERCLRIEPS